MNAVVVVLLLALVLVSGCSKLVPELYPPTPRPTSSVMVSDENITRTTRPTAVPYEAPTIEKITVSRYKRSTPTTTLTPVAYYHDPIVGKWKAENGAEAIFTTNGGGNSDLGGFSWYSTEGNNYSVSFYGGREIVAEYNVGNDTLSVEGYIMQRK